MASEIELKYTPREGFSKEMLFGDSIIAGKCRVLDVIAVWKSSVKPIIAEFLEALISCKILKLKTRWN